MDVLPYNFRTFTLSGMWYENSRFWPLKFLYRGAVMAVIFQFTIGEIVQLTRFSGSLDEFAEVLFVSFTFVALCVKIMNFVTRKSAMLQLLGGFRSDICQPKSPEEVEIVGRCSKIASKIFLGIMSTFQSTGMIIMVNPFLDAAADKSTLPFTSYQPYDASEGVGYWSAYVLQFIAGVYGVLIDVTMDTMVYGFILMSTAQFEIICHRLANSTADIGDCIKHHVLVQNIVLKIQTFFVPVIVPLFCFSLITLCTSIFQMSQKEITSFEFLSLVLYLGCMLCQVFLYCWFGNELELKSEAVVQAIYSSNWLELTIPDRRSLWLIMLRARRVSNISFHGQCGLSLNTFIWIVKTSYAAFNLLQQASI